MGIKLLGPPPSGVTDGATKGYVDNLGSAGNWRPEDHGIISWAYDPVTASAGSALTSGTVFLVGMQVRQSASATTIYWHNNAGATITSGQNEVGLYDSTGTRLTSVAIAGTSLTAGFKTHTFTAVALTPGMYWIALLFNGTTPPQPIRLATFGATGINVGLTAATARFATGPTGQTTLPSSLTPASNITSALSVWAALG